MSFVTLNWAVPLALPPRNSTAKSLLIALSFMARQTRAGKYECFPSIDHLVVVTGQNRKTLLRNLDKLERWGLLLDTGKRMGVTHQVVVYRLHMREKLCTHPPQTYAHSKKRRPKKAEKQPEKSLQAAQTRDTESNRNIYKKNRAHARDGVGARDPCNPPGSAVAGAIESRTAVQAVIDALARAVHPHRFPRVAASDRRRHHRLVRRR